MLSLWKRLYIAVPKTLLNTLKMFIISRVHNDINTDQAQPCYSCNEFSLLPFLLNIWASVPTYLDFRTDEFINHGNITHEK